MYPNYWLKLHCAAIAGVSSGTLISHADYSRQNETNARNIWHWRSAMEYFLIRHHAGCESLLDTTGKATGKYDAVGINLVRHPVPHYSGVHTIHSPPLTPVKPSTHSPIYSPSHSPACLPAPPKPMGTHPPTHPPNCIIYLTESGNQSLRLLACHPKYRLCR